MMEKNQATFGKLKYGLHGKPLPNFFYKCSSDDRFTEVQQQMQQQTTIEWWKN